VEGFDWANMLAIDLSFPGPGRGRSTDACFASMTNDGKAYDV
jgi:hypothetical protein